MVATLSLQFVAYVLPRTFAANTTEDNLAQCFTQSIDLILDEGLEVATERLMECAILSNAAGTYTLNTEGDKLTNLFGVQGDYNDLETFLPTTEENFMFASFSSTKHLVFLENKGVLADNQIAYPGLAQHIIDKDDIAQNPDLRIRSMSLLCKLCGSRDCVISTSLEYVMTFDGDANMGSSTKIVSIAETLTGGSLGTTTIQCQDGFLSYEQAISCQCVYPAQFLCRIKNEGCCYSCY